MLGFRARRSGSAVADERYFWTSDVLIDEFETIHRNEKHLIKDGRAPQPRPAPKDATAEDYKAERSALAAYYEAVHKFRKNDKEPGQTALCLSGGGIRSAAFALGVLQALARLKLLSQFDYLSTVSGGGYIGGWLSAWAAHEAKSAAQVADELAQIEASDGRRVGDEPVPLVQLRKNQDFITPKVGVGSPDTWAALAIVIRNILLNWAVFAPFIAGALFVPRVIEWAFLSWAESKPPGNTFLLDLGYAFWNLVLGGRSQWTPRAEWGNWHYWVDTIGVLFVVAALFNSIVNRFKPPNESFNESGFVRWVLTPLVLGAILLVMQSCYWAQKNDPPNARQFFEWVTFGSLVLTLPFLLAVFWWWAARKLRPDRKIRGALTPAEVRRGFPEFAAQFFTGAFVGALIWSGLWLRHQVTAGDAAWPAKIDAVLGVPWFLTAFLLGQVLLAGLTTRLYHLKSSVESSAHIASNDWNPMDGDRYREWWARAGGFYGAAALVWALASGLVIFGWDIVSYFGAEVTLAVTGAGAGAVSLLGGSPLSLRSRRR